MRRLGGSPPGPGGWIVHLLCSTHPDDRRAIGFAARERILAAHTAEHRAEELEAYVTAPVAA